MATIDYMVAAYGPYAASATGGNGFARDFLAAIAALGMSSRGCYDSDLYFLPQGPQIRARSKFAQSLEAEREKKIEVVEELRMRRRGGV